MSTPNKVHIDNYFKRFAVRAPIILEPLSSLCQMIIVIPCHNESDLIGTLRSLLDSDRPSFPVEVITIVNQSVDCQNHEVVQQNRNTIKAFTEWNKSVNRDDITFQIIKALDMPKKQAGVGLARKIGMDEALRRFDSIGVNGTIVCLDADCRVSKNYLSEIEKQFTNSNAGLGEVHFEHQFEHESNDKLRKGIINYELFLYYYVEGLKFSGYPFAIQTIGSCMLVKASTYAKHGGMNKRKAGEDFYFLHKIIPHEKFVEVMGASVYPSCRTSDRVPFGTGKAQQDWLDQASEDYLTYDPKVFDELKTLIDSVDQFFESAVMTVIKQLPSIPRAFVQTHEFEAKIELIKSNCKDIGQFRKQFFIWFDGFLCMKFVHFVRDSYYENIPIVFAANRLLKLDLDNEIMLLTQFREQALH
ncbi:glycosyltransferase family 2 protein [Roseivirga sp. E12]|uniref:glycosyltransferase n=1 Tax=Roseivirga sp. E12 TaxID=2819237 RepID=UPI001ABC210E|nr:glycosyltransferase [Roseivirga sp. E12]MBO3700393.1 glycosyltransferase [Roseivirga sp. E12]